YDYCASYAANRSGGFLGVRVSRCLGGLRCQAYNHSPEDYEQNDSNDLEARHDEIQDRHKRHRAALVARAWGSIFRFIFGTSIGFVAPFLWLVSHGSLSQKG